LTNSDARIPADESWRKFHQTWWGDPQGHVAALRNHSSPSRFLCVDNKEVITSFRFYYSDLFVREEYLVFAERCQKAREDTRIIGSLILGQPGIGTLTRTPTSFLTYDCLIFFIGKSLFLLFLLIDCLARQEVVLFTDYSCRMYLFDTDGVWNLKDPKRGLPETSRFFSLVDAPDNPALIPDAVTVRSFPTTFFVASLSPNPIRYKAVQKLNVVTWWMEPWTPEELFTLWVSCMVSVPTDP